VVRGGGRRAGQQGAQVQVPDPVLHQHGEAERIVAVTLVRDPEITSDDRLDALLARRRIEANRAEDVRAVGQRERALTVARGLLDRLVDPDDAVDDRELGVQPEMDEARTAHPWNSATREPGELWITRGRNAFAGLSDDAGQPIIRSTSGRPELAAIEG